MLGEHPILAPAIAALILGVFAIIAFTQGARVTGLLAYGDALGMTAIAAHSRIERDGM
jgi:hypothetical protein